MSLYRPARLENIGNFVFKSFGMVAGALYLRTDRLDDRPCLADPAARLASSAQLMNINVHMGNCEHSLIKVFFILLHSYTAKR